MVDQNRQPRANHPLQRESEQWSNEKKGNLISDILQSNPIPALTFAEQIINGIAITWILDGKQRSITTACAFANDMFKVSKKVRRGIISYQARESKGTNGVLDRVVIESVMTNNFIDDWKKNQSEMCSFLKENATEEMFDNFEDLVDRLSVIADENTLEKFDSKNSFLWFGLFGRFVNLGEPDKRFIEFMAEFSRSLHSKKIDGESFDDLMSNKSTKDKNVVIARIDKLTALMNGILIVVFHLMNRQNKRYLTNCLKTIYQALHSVVVIHYTKIILMKSLN